MGLWKYFRFTHKLYIYLNKHSHVLRGPQIPYGVVFGDLIKYMSVCENEFVSWENSTTQTFDSLTKGEGTTYTSMCVLIQSIGVFLVDSWDLWLPPLLLSLSRSSAIHKHTEDDIIGENHLCSQHHGVWSYKMKLWVLVCSIRNQGQRDTLVRICDCLSGWCNAPPANIICCPAAPLEYPNFGEPHIFWCCVSVWDCVCVRLI